MRTSFQIELAEQKRWRLRPEWSQVGWFDGILRSEFISDDEHRSRQASAVTELIQFVVGHVPYYKQLFTRLGLSPGDVRRPEDLARLPRLTKLDVIDRAAELRPDTLPPGHERLMATQSSGTTGRPAVVWHSNASRELFVLLKQRELRWFRFDPTGSYAAIRNDLPPQPDGSATKDGMTAHSPAWPLVGGYFETGPAFGFKMTNPLEKQVDWLEQHRPTYLLSQSPHLEHLAFAFQDRPPLDEMRCMIGISQQLTPDMQRRIETTFRAPVRQNYGLNEFGLVATRCPEAGRYHVHTEQNLVEIVDDAGHPCEPGKIGRVLVTTVSNPAMPLVRYDSDDLAEAVTGPCPCGRTLPTFGVVIGRYSRLAFLPPGSYTTFRRTRDVLEIMPAELARPLRQFQVHQFRDGHFELRLAVAEPLRPEFIERVHRAWAEITDGRPTRLDIVQLARLEPGPGGKFQDFTSDFTPPPDGIAANHQSSTSEPMPSDTGARP
jgi:phenylacetate-CoA ligase